MQAQLEQTIAGSIAFSGIGLHSGAPVHLRLLPAPAGTGIVFRRTDLDNFEIQAIGRNVAKVSYATSLMRQGVLISTTEHLLSACIGTGIDNVIVELDNLELPILDGSALPYVEAFHNVGIKIQRRRREYIRILRKVEVRENDKFIGVYPGDGYSITYEIDFPHAHRPAGVHGRSGRRRLRRRDRRRPHLRLPRRRAHAARHGADPRRIGGERHHPDAATACRTAACAFPMSSSATRCSTSSATSRSPATASSAVSSPSAPATPCTLRWSRACSPTARAWELITLPQLEVTRRPARAARFAPVQV